METSVRRIYITLNSSKNKDRVITSFLSSYYSEKDAIKEILYQCAIRKQLGLSSTDRVQKDNGGDE